MILRLNNIFVTAIILNTKGKEEIDLKELIQGRDFIFDQVYLLHFKCHKTNLNHVGPNSSERKYQVVTTNAFISNFLQRLQEIKFSINPQMQNYRDKR